MGQSVIGGPRVGVVSYVNFAIGPSAQIDRMPSTTRMSSVGWIQHVRHPHRNPARVALPQYLRDSIDKRLSNTSPATNTSRLAGL